ncbi:MAG TPA: GLUG motif-containing protein [Candidatus Diapherotrites archaeon]|nr:GLUG motif-containing protein [Candidatus Diapherotrites archaeon]
MKLKDSGMVCSSSGTGTEEDPIVVCNADDLNAVRLNLDANYVLGKDIDLKCYSRRDENGWEPIGTFSSRFSGSFDGQNHIISNMYINRPTTTGIGFFSRTTKSSIIKNIGLKDANIYGGNYMGCLCGYNKGTVTNSYATGYIKATLSGAGHANIGGLVGANDGGLIQDSYFEGNVLGYGAGSMVGGLIGQTVNGGRISNCFAKGSVYGVGDYVGGLSGANDCGGTVDCYIENCYADCSVVGLRTAVGGLVGATVTGTGAASVIKHSYSKGNVTGVNYVGGIVGYNIKGTFNSNYSFSNVHRSSGGNTGFGGFVGYNKSGKIINSYSIGTVSGNSWTPTDKGFSGLITTGGIYEDTNNFYDTETSLQTSTAGNALGKTTEEMKQQQTYVGWDFTNVWAIDPNKNNGYPYFKWQD